MPIPSRTEHETRPLLSTADLAGHLVTQGKHAISQESAVSELRCVEILAPHLAGQPWALDAWVPDTDEHNPLARDAAELGAAVARDLDPTGHHPLSTLPTSGAVLAQIALVAKDRAFAGTVPTDHALTQAPGGRARMRVGADRPSRAARKVEEALAWLGERGIRVHELPVERDLDTPRDVLEWFAIARSAGPEPTYPRTWKILHALMTPRRFAELESRLAESH